MGERRTPETGTGPKKAVRNQVRGEAGNVVQADRIAGDVHIHRDVYLFVTGGFGVLRDGNPVRARPLSMAGCTSSDARAEIVATVGGAIEQVWPDSAPRRPEPEAAGEAARPGSAPPPVETEPRTLVLDGIDEASEPERVLREVLAPVAGHGIRLVLAFRSGSSAALRVARELWPEQDGDPEVFLARLDLLARAVDELAQRENALHRHHAHVAGRIAGAPAVPDRAIELRLVVTGLRRDDPGMAPEERAQRLARAEADVEATSRLLRERRGELDSLVERRDDLRGLLEAYRAQAIDHGFVEDVVLDEPYRRSHDALWRRGPCDLDAATELVRGYGAAVRARIGPA
ncbi:hypothetical protein OOZ19_03685 [Saccharopolyspora sp. NFXS83]|uniref:hypothetical protein n=1 Tax=Saccharopolyspora sp. NFXS83 TaxID=2993560 RepID=UPI00224B52FE|nr:hypothetical protein [Saccharopolyspora sp. NFXS83]MCX2729330.1 hypothetical protein [Saccharopolyspora sp. NFXS83]